MPWIKVIDETDATEKLKEIYEKIRKERGKISNIMKIHSLSPTIMEKHLDLYHAIMFTCSGISREERELIAVIVSSVNQCEYCIHHHAEALNFYWKDNELIRKLITDHETFNFSKRNHKMIKYVVKLTRTPSEIRQSDIQELRECGFSDEEILHITLITAYFNFVNRIALGLGVRFSDEEVKGYRY